MLFLISPCFFLSRTAGCSQELRSLCETDLGLLQSIFSLRQNCLVSPPFLRYGLSPDLVTIIIPCSLGNGYCTFSLLIFIIVKRNFLYYSLYILTEKSLKHLCSIRAWVPVSFFLSFSLSLFPSLWLSLSLSYCQLRTARSWSIKGPQQVAPQNRDSGIRGISVGGTQDLLRSGPIEVGKY